MASRTTAFTPSLLDRLIDACHGIDRPQTARLDSLVDDIEALLNTCCIATNDQPDAFPETAASIQCYGSPAPQATSVNTHDERNATARRIEKTLRRFEPRLKRVRVRIEDPKSRSPMGRFRIEANLGDDNGLSLALHVRSTSGRTQIIAERS
jgi:type VI secretion system lysozyme-like protein